MFYSYLRTLLTFLLWAINGNIHYHDREKILPQEENYILIAPHKTFWDPVFLGYAAAPKQFIFMAKKNSSRTAVLVGGFQNVELFPLTVTILAWQPSSIQLTC